MKYIIEYQDQFNRWRRYGETHSEINAYQTTQNLAKRTGKKYRLVDEKRNLIDLIVH